MHVVGLLLDGCDRVLPLLRSPVLSDRWTEASALEQWSNGGLAGHLARSAFNLERAVRQPRRETPVVDAVTYYSCSAPQPAAAAIGRRIRELGEQEAAAGPAALADRFAASMAFLRERALALGAPTAVEMFGQVLTIEDCAAACLLELVVHADDLTVSLGLAPVTFSEPAVDMVVVTLSRISRQRHGDLAVIRSLSRSERAPVQGISAF